MIIEARNLSKKVIFNDQEIVILDDISNFTKIWNEKLKNDVVWPKVKKLINDYKKFLTYDKKKCTIILNNFINQFYS